MNDSFLSRRRFLQQMLLGASALTSGLLLPGRNLLAAPAPVPRTLVNIMLYGGADLRFVMAPDPVTADPTYIDQYWQARQRLYGSYSSYADMYAAKYTTVSSGVSFGIHNSCGWLIAQFNLGNAAIVSNTYGSLNRSHDFSQLIVQSGDLQAERTIIDRDGWGGRVVENLSGTPNVLELSSGVQTFCKGSDETFRLKQVIHAQNMRDMGLPQPSQTGTSSDDNLIRALNAYYKARAPEIQIEKPANWPFRKFFQHHAAIQNFGEAIAAELASVPMPATLADLNLNSGSFERQCRNLYDACQTAGVLNYRLMAMSYGGWDTHTGQNGRIVGNLSDVLGSGGGLATAHNEISTQARDNLVFHLSWDFGRQLAANGSNGTDHGRGNYTILVGNPLQGGVYGELFPDHEAQPDPGDSQGRTPFEIPGRDIKGQTSLEHVWSAHCDWLQSGIAANVFPNTAGAPLESGVDLSTLYT